MSSVFNFGAGPSALPKEVLEQAQVEMLDWQESGISVMEMSHRSQAFMSIAESCEADFRQLIGVPDDYQVLFLQGGATSQFAMVPMNLSRDRGKALYVYTGSWSKKAITEARLFCDVKIASSSEQDRFTLIPPLSTWQIDDDAAFLHYTSNETINGVEFQSIPEIDLIPLVSDMSSNIFSRPIDVERFGLIYAGAQKNLGPAGVTVVIVRDDLIGKVIAGTPSMYNYRLHADNRSMLNTPPTYNWYILGLVLQWIKREGGVESIEQRNIRKARRLYHKIDQSSFYSNPVNPAYRSRMNVPFILASAELDGKFLSEAAANGLMALKGHRSVGGMRASLYNAMPEEGVDTLIEFMREFERNNG